MAEIKSTLEIIMERAKGISVTEEEKKAFRKKEVEGKAKGLLLKCSDGLLKPEDLKNEINAFGENDRAAAKEAILKQCFGLIFPDEDNSLAFNILDQSGVDIAPVKTLVLKFKQDMDNKKGAITEKIRTAIYNKGISGSAVIPNPEADPAWNDSVNDSRRRFQMELQETISF